MATSPAWLWYYQPSDSVGLPAITFFNFGGYPVTITDFQVHIDYVTSGGLANETICIVKPVYINGVDYKAGLKWLDLLLQNEDDLYNCEKNQELVTVQLEGASANFKKSRYKLTNIEVSGRIHPGKDISTYRSIEMIDSWALNTETMANITGRQRIMRGADMEPPVADYIG
jgi:hypothetical protein